MVAFSVSSVTSGASGSIVSPGLTRTSITATSLKLPMSGTRTSTSPAAAFIVGGFLYFPGYGLAGIDAERLDRLHDGGAVDFAFIGEGFERRHGDVVAIHFKVLAQGGAGVGTAE